ncbi:hypothetical protein D9613_008508 [Agrocybe pediades]|uniref:Aldehyde dehydrogenase domain-containing protein n=1 Tax=Agrocybe pediades TaxID=84607 RepID=A0A8H4QUM4_9AGAR|nr:hypothetical protein D9613_008508 [Agrocybe pediades]
MCNVLNDANVSEAARCIVSASMTHSGQVCMATSRVIVQSGIADKLIGAIKDIVQPFKAGDVQTAQSVQMGALFSEASADNAISMVKDAQANGAEVILGDLNKNGAVIQPHLVKNVAPGMRLWDREVFGPVLSIATFETVDEAVSLANASDYSLSASVYSADVWAAKKIASRIRSGYTNINGPSIHSESIDGLVGLGGASGYGRFNIESFTHKTVIVIHPAERKLPLVG